MTRNYIDHGDVADDLVAPAGGVTGGLIYVVAGIAYVAQTNAVEGDPWTGKSSGRWTLPKSVHASNQAIADGGPVYWDATAKACTNVAAGNTLLGGATGAALSTDDEVTVRLWPRPPAQDITDPPANTAPTNSTPYGFSQAQAVALLAWVRDADVALKAAGVIK